MVRAYTPEQDVSSCAGAEKKATAMLLEAVRLFLREAGKMITLRQMLEKASFVKRRSTFQALKLITILQVCLPIVDNVGKLDTA